MTTLQRYGAAAMTWPVESLNAILLSLQTTANHLVETDNVAYIFLGVLQLYILDLTYPANRRLYELFTMTLDTSNMFEVRFTQGGNEFDLNNALTAAGFGAQSPVSSLASVYQVRYDVSSSVLDTASNLVSTGGIWSTTPAQLVTLSATAPLSLSSSGSTLSLAQGNPTYGTGLGDGTVSISWSTTDKLLFAGDLTATPIGDSTIVSLASSGNPSYGTASANGTDYTVVTWNSTSKLAFASPMTASIQDSTTIITSPSALQAGTIQNSSPTLLPNPTSALLFESDQFTVLQGSPSNDIHVSLKQSYIDSLIDNKIATLIQNITFGSDFTATRTATTLAVDFTDPNAPLYSWPAGVELYFDGSVSPSIQVDPSVTNQAGSAITIANLSTTTWTISFDWNINSGQVNANHYVFACNGVFSYNQAPSGQWLNGSTGYIALGSPAISNGQWQSVKFTYDSSVGLKMYVDAALIGTLPTSIVSMANYAGKLTVSEDIGGGYDTSGYWRNFSVSNLVL